MIENSLNFCDLRNEYIDDVYRIEQENIAEAWSKNNIANLISDKSAVARVGVIDNKVVCYYSYYNIGGEGFINNLAVDKKYQGQGFGNLLIEDMIMTAKQSEVFSLTLEVEEDNKVAIALYNKYGFEQEGIRKNFYKNKKNALIMWLRKL